MIEYHSAHSFNNYLFRVFSVPDTILGTEEKEEREKQNTILYIYIIICILILFIYIYV